MASSHRDSSLDSGIDGIDAKWLNPAASPQPFSLVQIAMPAVRVARMPWKTSTAAEEGFMNLIALRGRHAVVTGGAQGIGRAIAERFLASGASISLWDRDAEQLEAAARELAMQGEVQAFSVDVTS